jgi:hypothetical protein
MVEKLATGPLCQTAVMVIVEERHQPLMQPLHNSSNCPNPLVGIRTTHIVSISMIAGAVHCLLLTPQPDSMQWYLSYMIDLNSSNLLYIYNI